MRLLTILLYACLGLIVFACEQDRSLTAAECNGPDASCVRIRNATDFDLENATVRLNYTEDPVHIGKLSAGATSDYYLFRFADYCNYRLDATHANAAPIRSGGWVCVQPDPLGAGRFTIEVSLSPAIPAEMDILDAELIAE